MKNGNSIKLSSFTGNFSIAPFKHFSSLGKGSVFCTRSGGIQFFFRIIKSDNEKLKNTKKKKKKKKATVERYSSLTFLRC